MRILLAHPNVSIKFVYSSSQAGNAISNVHQDLVAFKELTFTSSIDPEIDVLFLCLGHGNSTAFLDKHIFSPKTKIIDLSNDFRLAEGATHQGKQFVYGLPELLKERIKNSGFIANPGCFATAIQLALLPLAFHKKIKKEVHAQATTGATGAGTSLSQTTHFTWRDNNFSHYKAFEHQHLGEIHQTMSQLQSNFDSQIHFIPFRGNFSRGIFATVYTQYDGSLEEAQMMYKDYYQDAAFTHISDNSLHLKQVVNTNNCMLHLLKHNDQLLITSCIDNLVKGASGQAVQNMNLMFGFNETEGLQLKATYF